MSKSKGLAQHHRVIGAFLVMGIAFGSIFTRIADIQLQLAVGQAVIGLALVGTAVGLMTAVTFLAPRVDGWGSKRTLLFALPLVGLASALAAIAPSVPVLFASLVLFGMAAGIANTVINVEADRVEAAIGRRIMNRCHAGYSVGFMLSSLLGGIARQVDIAPLPHLAGTTVLLILLSQLLWRGLEPAPPRILGADSTSPRFAWPTPSILLLGAFALAAMLYEGAAADWGVIYMRDVLAAEPFMAGLSLAMGSLAQAVTRAFADRFVERHGPVSVARTLLAVLLVGAVVVTFSLSAPLTLLGFALMGIGTAVIVPLAISAAARRTDRPAAVNVAALTQLSWLAFFAGPPLLGAIAEQLGSRFTFGAGVPLVLLSLLLARNALVGAPPNSGRKRPE